MRRMREPGVQVNRPAPLAVGWQAEQVVAGAGQAGPPGGIIVGAAAPTRSRPAS